MEGNLPFLLCFTLYLRAIFQVQARGGGGGGGAYIRKGDFTEGFLCYEFGGLIHGGGYFPNFTLFQHGIQIWPHISSFKCAFTRILNEILENF